MKAAPTAFLRPLFVLLSFYLQELSSSTFLLRTVFHISTIYSIRNAQAQVFSSMSSTSSSTSNSSPSSTNTPDIDEDRVQWKIERKVNFASESGGAVIMEASPGFGGADKLLLDDKDKYGIVECSLEKKWVVIGLSEDILVESVVLTNYEQYSSYVEKFQILGSTSYPVTQWADLGTYTADNFIQEQTFNITNPTWARYLRFKFISYYGKEFYCTLTQIKIHGKTVYETLQREVERSTQEASQIERLIQQSSEEILSEHIDNIVEDGRKFVNENERSNEVKENSLGENITEIEEISSEDSLTNTNGIQDMTTPSTEISSNSTTNNASGSSNELNSFYQTIRDNCRALSNRTCSQNEVLEIVFNLLEKYRKDKQTSPIEEITAEVMDGINMSVVNASIYARLKSLSTETNPISDVIGSGSIMPDTNEETFDFSSWIRKWFSRPKNSYETSGNLQNDADLTKNKLPDTSSASLFLSCELNSSLPTLPISVNELISMVFPVGNRATEYDCKKSQETNQTLNLTEIDNRIQYHDITNTSINSILLFSSGPQDEIDPTTTTCLCNLVTSSLSKSISCTNCTLSNDLTKCMILHFDPLSPAPDVASNLQVSKHDSSVNVDFDANQETEAAQETIRNMSQVAESSPLNSTIEGDKQNTSSEFTKIEINSLPNGTLTTGSFTSNTSTTSLPAIELEKNTSSRHVNSTRNNSGSVKASLIVCLENIKFVEFHTRMKSKTSQNLQEGLGSATLPGSQDVLRHLVQKIGALETNYKIIEHYLEKSSECYQEVLGANIVAISNLTELLHSQAEWHEKYSYSNSSTNHTMTSSNNSTIRESFNDRIKSKTTGKTDSNLLNLLTDSDEEIVLDMNLKWSLRVLILSLVSSLAILIISSAFCCFSTSLVLMRMKETHS